MRLEARYGLGRPRMRKGEEFSAEKNPKRKEVRLMKYVKPQIVLSEDAKTAIQGLMKAAQNLDSITHTVPSTSSAYEADERD